ncbi:MAG: methionyl-tRNA formyltransferase [candidate division WOR-3 bacterium]|nr:MAG: methionyl-tRNA formyltransferase [candidate division WOR-3 bacterium]
MTLLFFGSTDFSLPILQRLHDEYGVLAVVVSKPKPKGRGLKSSLPEIARWAESAGMKVCMPEDPNSGSFISELKALEPDLYVLSAYGHILSKDVLDIARIGGINIHPSLLPKYRGAAPIQRAIMSGEEETGVTIFFMDEKIDHGAVIAQRCIPIEKDDTFGSLATKLAKLGGDMIVETIHTIESGGYRSVKQEGEVTYAPKLKKEEMMIDWRQEALKVYNHIRALSPYPGARTRFRDKELIITLAQLGDKNLTPGALLVDSRKLYVGAGNGSLVLLELKPEGRKIISALDFVNGYRIQKGEIVG